MKKEIFFLILILAIRVSYAQSSEKFVPNSLNTDTEKENTLLCDLNAETIYLVQTNVFNSEDTVYNNESVLTLTDSGNDGKPCPGAATVTDYDGNTYNTVMIGNQCWMRENLRTTHYANGNGIPMGSTYTRGRGDSYSKSPYRYAPNGNSEYGYLYNAMAVMGEAKTSSTNPSGVQGICPSGWHVPSKAEWEQLKNYVMSKNQYQCGNEVNIAKSMAATTGWEKSSKKCNVGNNPDANNATSFSFLPAGYFHPDFGFLGIGTSGGCWSVTQSSTNEVGKKYFCFILKSEQPQAIDGYMYEFFGYSVRCVRNVENKGGQTQSSAPPAVGKDGQPCLSAAKITDYDGNTYNTVRIGDQCWMKENLRTTHYANGKSIPLGTTYSSTTPYRYLPNGDSEYGYLYNVMAVMGDSYPSTTNPSGAQGICPNGWHVPSEAEWIQLKKYVESKSQYNCGGGVNIAKSLASTTGWSSPFYSYLTCYVGNNCDKNNATRFSALPAGYYDIPPDYYNEKYKTQGCKDFGESCMFWSVTQDETYTDYYYSFHLYYDKGHTEIRSDKGLRGYSVRCVCDIDNNGVQSRPQAAVIDYDGRSCTGTATVTDYDGNTYNTVRIGDQCWMKENLRTTHYANGKSIPLGGPYSYGAPYRYCPDNNSSNVTKYGYLYNALAVMGGADPSSTNPSGVQGICPNGWHVPSKAEWIQFKNYVENKKDNFNNKKYVCYNKYGTGIAKALAATIGWINEYEDRTAYYDCTVGTNPETNNATGFSALPAGYYQEIVGKCIFFGGECFFWSATKMEPNSIYSSAFYSFGFYYSSSGVGGSHGLNEGFSVRCVRD